MMKHIREHDVSGIHIEAPHARTLKHLVAPWTLGSTRMWVGMTKIEPRSRSNRHKHPDQEEIFYVVSGVVRSPSESKTTQSSPVR
jgi:uncharacterized RmlC-like cupin family protein